MTIFLENANWSEIWVITAVGYLVVFTALVGLIFVFKYMPKVLKFPAKMKMKREGKLSEAGEEEYIAGEVNAAIGTALGLYFTELHDEESKVITIKRVKRRYSPWSSKIYNMNNVLPFRR